MQQQVGGCADVTIKRTFEAGGPGSQSMLAVGRSGAGVTCGLALTDVVGTVTSKEASGGPVRDGVRLRRMQLDG